jgi:hypothetical protein
MTPSYHLRECPYCHKHYANVRNHIHMKHQVEPAVLTPADLLGESKPTPPEPEYFCTSCQAIVRRGQSECWQCGAELEWSSL